MTLHEEPTYDLNDSPHLLEDEMLYPRRGTEGHRLVAGVRGAETGNRRERLLFIDNLRLTIIAFVVMHHLAVTYSGFGSWYYVEGTPLDMLSTIWFAWYLSFQQAYFMGLLFMIAGYFVAGSYDRRGFYSFVGERFRRLIVPTLIYMVAITPFIEYGELGNPWTGFDFIGFLSGNGVMWFAIALFFFSLTYGVARLLVREPAPASSRHLLEPSFANAVVLILIVAGVAFLIRIVQPIGTSILNMQLGYFASYILLFVVGILAYRHNLFERIDDRAGRRWLIGGIGLGFLAWLALVVAATITGTTAALNGGLTLQSALYSVWESFVAVAMSIGLIAVFREKFNRQNTFVKQLSDSSFAVYMFHPPILVAVALLASPLSLYPIVKWALLCVVCVPLCFATTTFVIRKIPLLKNVL